MKGRHARKGRKSNTQGWNSVEIMECAACGCSEVRSTCEATSKEVEVNHKRVNVKIQEVEANTHNEN